MDSLISDESGDGDGSRVVCFKKGVNVNIEGERGHNGIKRSAKGNQEG